MVLRFYLIYYILSIWANFKKIEYIKYLNNDSINLINDYYDNDFNLFNYTKIKYRLNQKKLFQFKKFK